MCNRWREALKERHKCKGCSSFVWSWNSSCKNTRYERNEGKREIRGNQRLKLLHRNLTCFDTEALKAVCVCLCCVCAPDASRRQAEAEPGESKSLSGIEEATMMEEAQRIVNDLQRRSCSSHRLRAGREQDAAHMSKQRDKLKCILSIMTRISTKSYSLSAGTKSFENWNPPHDRIFGSRIWS